MGWRRWITGWVPDKFFPQVGLMMTFAKTRAVVLAVLTLACSLCPLRSQAAKTATSATINIMADDYYDIYINGTKLAQPACATNGPFYCKNSNVQFNILP